MRGEPIEPVLFEVAVRELWEKFAAHAGINLREHQIRAGEDQSPEQQEENRAIDVRLGEFRDEAQLRIWGLALIGELKSWLGDGEHWRRPTEHQLRERLTRAADEPTGLYLDRVEVDAVSEERWSNELTSALPTSLVGKTRGQPGRRAGVGGYAKDDEPLLGEMLKLLETGKVRSRHRAAVMVVARAEGMSKDESKIRRLVDRFGPWPRDSGD